MTAPRETAAAPVIWTIGHSTRPEDLFLALLDAHGVRAVADVRTSSISEAGARRAPTRRTPHS